MTLEDKVQSLRLHALQRAQQLGNVSAACRELGISRTVFYRWRSQLAKYGVDGLHPKRRSANRGRPHSLSVQDEQAILALAVGYPTRGPQFYSYKLAQLGRCLSPSAIYRALRRVGLGTHIERLTLLERHSAQRAGLLTERTRRELQKARRQRRHVQASIQATWSVWTLSTSESLKASEKSGKSQLATPPARMRSPGSCQPTMPERQGSSFGTSPYPSRKRAGLSNGC